MKEYLGDSVYVDWEPHGQMLVLTTENGLGPSNTIYLEDEVYAALTAYVLRLQRAHGVGPVPRLDSEDP